MDLLSKIPQNETDRGEKEGEGKNSEVEGYGQKYELING
jgi:hypothetical protein